MIDELLDRATKHRNDGQDLRRKARKETRRARRNRLFDDAAAEFQKAIIALERGLEVIRRQQGKYSDGACLILEALSQTYGSLGGTWRDAKDLKTSIKLYDQGNKYEEERRRKCDAKDTYNMLQRLIVRLLEDPTLLDRATFRKQLNAVRRVIQSQVNKGREDSWALADLALARFLCGVGAEKAIDVKLKERRADATFYESTYNVIATLIDEGLGKGGALGNGLQEFRNLLRQRGGLP